MTSRSSKAMTANQILATLILTLLLAGCGDGDSKTAVEVETQDVSAQIASAKQFQEKGQYRSALIELRNATQAAPGHVEAITTWADLMLELGQAKEASDMLEEIENPSDAINLKLAKAYLRQGKNRSARETLTLVVTEGKEAQILKGQLALADLDFEGANTAFAALPLEDVEVRLGLAGAALGLTEFADAREHLEAILVKEPGNTRALFSIAQMEQRAGDLEMEEEYLMLAISTLPTTDIITPTRYSVLSALQNNLTRQGKTSEAMIYSDILTDATPGAEGQAQQMQSAVDMLKDGQFAEARAILDEILEDAPGASQATTLLAVVDFLEGNTEAASIKFEDVIDPETSTPTALQLFALTELRLNQPEKVVERLAKDIDSRTDANLNSLYAIALASDGQFEESEKYFRRSIELEQSRGRLYMPLARLLNSRDRRDEALSTLEQGFEADPEDALVQRALIAQYLTMERQGAVERLVAKIESDYPESQQTQLLVANFHLQQNELDKGSAGLLRVLDLGPSRIAQHQYAGVLLQQEKHDDALAQFRELLEQEANDADAYKGIVTVYELKGEIEKAIEELTRSYDAGRDTAALVLGEYYGRNGDLAGAEEWLDKYSGSETAQTIRLKKSLTISKARAQLVEGNPEASRTLLLEGLEKWPQSTRILGSLATLAINQNQLDEAQGYIEQYGELSNEPVLDLLKGDLANKRSNYLDAIQSYRNAWDRQSTDQVAFKLFSVLQSARRSPDDITAFLEEWVEKLPRSEIAAVTQAGFLFSIGEAGEAGTHYESIIERNPRNTIALNNLAWIYGENELDKALDVARQAYDLASNRAEIIDTYGWFLFKSGDVAQAGDLLRQAAELAPDNADIREHLTELEAAAASPGTLTP